MAQKKYDRQWQVVDSLEERGLFQSALDIVDDVYSDSREKNLYGHTLKALLYRIRLEAKFQEDSYVKAIAFVSTELESAQPPVRHILSSMLAQLYWDYYMDKRWEIMGRTAVAGDLPADIATWDSRSFVRVTTRYFLESLTDADLLIQTDLVDFEDILEKKQESRKLRPTLYDFLAFRAIDFFSDEQAAVTKPYNAFQVNETDFFAPAGRFAELELDTSDTGSFTYITLMLYRNLIRAHVAGQADSGVRTDADLLRLAYVHRLSTLPNKDSLYAASLEYLLELHEGDSVSAEIGYQLAQHYQQQGYAYKPLISEDFKWEVKKALSLAEKMAGLYPDTDGGNNCRVLANQIRSSLLNVTGNREVIPGKPSLVSVNYRNVDSLYLRIISTDPEKHIRMLQRDQRDMLTQWLTLKPVKSWSLVLPDDGDFQSHRAEIMIPSLSPGYYVLLVSATEEFSAGSDISHYPFWSTHMGLIYRKSEDGSTEMFMIDRDTGSPLKGIDIQLFSGSYDYGQGEIVYHPGQAFKSGKTGYVRIPRDSLRTHHSAYVKLSRRNEIFMTEPFWEGFYQAPEQKAETRTFFFTDRAIYRPGQTIYFKGIVLEKQGNKSEIMKDHPVTLQFHDVNGQELSSLDVRTNEYGSFSGLFTVPQGVLTGQMLIQGGNGQVSVQVEEYKRPKFSVSFEPVEGAFKLGDSVEVAGTVQTYAGSAVSDAQIRYRVVRNARFPYWRYGWRSWFPTSPEMEITFGETVSGENGEFSIRFHAIPDPSVPESYSPVFSYTVYADVTDINGETQTGQTLVSAGYDALIVSTSLEEYMNGAAGLTIHVKTTNLAGQPEPASGSLTLTRLNRPADLFFSRKWSRPDRFTMTREAFSRQFPGEIYDNEDDVTTWQRGEVVFKGTFKSPADSGILVSADPKPGYYVAEIKTRDRFGKEVGHTRYFSIFKPGNRKTEAVSPLTVHLLKSEAEPGQTVPVVVASPLRNGLVWMEAESEGRVVLRKTIRLNRNQVQIDIPVTEADRGNIVMNFTMVNRNRVFSESLVVLVPHTHKELDITLGSFRSALEPGEEEEWQVTIRDKKGDRVAAELLAAMYDASLDVFTPHTWQFTLYGQFRGITPWNTHSGFNIIGGHDNWYPRDTGSLRFREYESLLGWNVYGRGYGGIRYMMKNSEAGDMVLAQDAEVAMEMQSQPPEGAAPLTRQEDAVGPPSPDQDISQPMKPRKDFSETAFFFPQIATNPEGETVLKFRMPESLTQWRVMALAHSKDLKTGQIDTSLVTRKDLMVFPNAPRFLREGDRMQFSVRISNVSGQSLTGQAELQFFDAITMKPVDGRMSMDGATRDFTLEPGGNSHVAWGIIVPEGLQAVVYRVKATAGQFSDGEEAPLPVLTNRMLVTESLPLPVRGHSIATFNHDKLAASGKPGSTLRNHKLTLEYTSHPAWYAVQAMPYLMEYPYDCSEQVFSRFYANTLASHIAHSDPKIRRVFDAWKLLSPDAFRSNLEKNAEFVLVLLEETPWVREASGESERKQRLGLLFDLNRLASEQKSALRRLKELQTINGGWPWFPGMPENEFVTRHVVIGLGRLMQMGAIRREQFPEMEEMLAMAIRFLDQRMLRSFEQLKKENPDFRKNNHLSHASIHYLFARTYFLAEYPVDASLTEMVEFHKDQAVAFWPQGNNYMKAMTALLLHRFGESEKSSAIMRSLAETALHDQEMGMYWRNQPRGWLWHEAPVETQALMIEAFDEVAGDREAVEALKVWLLKQKQTRHWGNTKATTEAIYALLMRGESLLSAAEPVAIRVGGTPVDMTPADGTMPEPGTGYFRTSWETPEIKPEMSRVEVNNPNPGAAWGAMYWQYFEQLDKITPAETPLRLRKNLFREVNTIEGPVLEAVTEETPLRVGDRVVVRVILSADRDMEYVHLKDMRGAAFEPMNVLSGYRWEGGIGYYESTRDAASHFFIGYLPKGTYVFEYRLHATQRGEFSNGITSVQCMYAPEFSAHSEGIRISVE